VVHWLLSQLEDNQKLDSKNPDYTLPLAKYLLASQLGITSETLSRVFARLRERKLAVVEGRHLREIDITGLRSFLFEVEGDI
jgi:CRP/FNR family transcriptional regulator